MSDFFAFAYIDNEIKFKERIMDNNNLKDHICNNTQRQIERDMQMRMNGERGYLSRGEHNLNTSNCKKACEDISHIDEVFVINMPRAAERNGNFREAIWTGKYLQTTLMSINRGDDIGIELHADTDQYIRIERGDAIALLGEKQDALNRRYELHRGDAIYVPAGVWHNIINAGRCSLKISSTYAPPHHPKGTVEQSKK